MFRRIFLASFVVLILSACEFPANGNPTPVATAVIPTGDQASTTDNQTPPPASQPASQPTSQPTNQLTNQPTPQPSPTPLPPAPTPTYDPRLPPWTVLVYMNGDNNLETAALIDIDEMEAAGSSDQVTILIQLDRAVGESAADGDWTDARRYRILPDETPDILGSELVAELGEVNMGDPMVLADFLEWGIANYPANRYALIIWDHGAGWNGIAFDEDTAEFGVPDFISLPDLDGALANAFSRTGVDKLDLVGFDACLMGQLDVFQTIVPYADYAVGSEELTPGQGWDYATFLGHLVADPAVDGAGLARQMTADFIATYTRREPDDFVTMSAVDLSQLEGVTISLSQLAAALMMDPAVAASAVGDARSGVEAYARVYADEFDRYAAVDLHHFANILAQRSPDQQVKAAAERVVAAVETAVIANERGSGLKNSGGIAIYFPRQERFYETNYGSVTANGSWDDFLQQYYSAGQAQLPPPQLQLTDIRQSAVGAQNPAYLDFQIVGREIEQVILLAGGTEEDGRRRLLEYDLLIPEQTYLPDGNRLTEWRDGVHDDFFIWDTEVTYLYDSNEAGDFVVMRPATVGADGRRLFTVQGRFQRAEEPAGVEASLVFDHTTGQLLRVWGVASDASQAPAEIVPQPDDIFQIYSLYLDDDLEISREPGPSLAFDEAGQLYFDWRPLPSGSYFLGMAAENIAGDTAVSFTELTVNNDDILTGYETYLDPYLGFQFLYPAEWYAPVYTGTLLYTTDRANTTQVQITLYPHLERGTAAEDLKSQSLAQFGPVDILFEDEVKIAGQSGLLTAYGYEREDGSARTGIFLTFAHSRTGYVVDLDGPFEEEEATLTAVDAIASSWQFVPAGAGLPPGRWAQVDLAAFSVAQPADFVYQEVNDWQRFSSDRYTFVALRAQPATLSVSDVLEALVRDAGSGMQDFVTETAVRTLLGGVVWERVNFSYVSDIGRTIWGFIMVKIEDDQEVVAWVEAPSDTYNQLEQSVFLVMVADMSLSE